jgi:hypothetical protein
LGESPSPAMNVAKGLVGVLAWALIAFGISYIGFGIFNDLNWVPHGHVLDHFSHQSGHLLTVYSVVRIP